MTGDDVDVQVGDDVLFFTTDGAGSDYLINGVIPGVFPTVDFGCGGDSEAAFRLQRRFLGAGGPPVNSEFYPGWLDHWQSPHSKVDTGCIVNTLGRTSSCSSCSSSPHYHYLYLSDKMLSQGANVNIYMAFGGTSFGFTAGSNSGPFQATPTSYDYDAPITEVIKLVQDHFLCLQRTFLFLRRLETSLRNSGPLERPLVGTFHYSQYQTLFRMSQRRANMEK